MYTGFGRIYASCWKCKVLHIIHVMYIGKHTTLDTLLFVRMIDAKILQNCVLQTESLYEGGAPVEDFNLLCL